MRMTDNVVQYILSLLEAEHGSAEFRRNELAETMGCVPSQISYVIASRFTPEQGYLVESRRGGGGYIRITRIKRDTPTLLMHLVNSIGESFGSCTDGRGNSQQSSRKEGPFCTGCKADGVGNFRSGPVCRSFQYP